MASSSVVGLALENKWTSLAGALIVYIVTLCIYRRVFHPLAKVPGPFLPAVTMLYQSCFNYKFYLQIERLHAQYGPIVRINPNEVHISDTESYDRIQFVGTKFTKSPNFYDSLCAPYSSFGAIDNAVHKMRRGAMNPMFSRQKVLELESIVQEKANKVCKLMQNGVKSGEAVDLHHAFRSVSIDVASSYAFGSEHCYNFLDNLESGERFCEMAKGIGPALWVFQQIPAFQKIALATPPWLAPYFSTPLGYVTGLQMECVKQIDAVKQKMRERKDLGRQTVFTTLLTPEDKPEGYQVPTTWQIKDEAYSVLVAAADTTGNAMTVAAFNVLYTPQIYEKLSAELQQHFPDSTAPLSFVELEKLPYLTGVIKEGIRLSFGVIGRLPRVVPPGGAVFHGHHLPPGTVVSMSCWTQHRNPAIWGADPMKFDPERWLDPEAFHAFDKHIVSFGKGSRQCVGMPLAYAELYVTLGTLFRRFPRGLRTKTTPDIMVEYEDYFSSYHPYSTRDKWLKAYMEPSS